jgi:hypothetical protein
MGIRNAVGKPEGKSDISSSHSGEYEDDGLLGYIAVKSR